MDRRGFLKYSAALGATVSSGAFLGAACTPTAPRAAAEASPTPESDRGAFRWSEATIAQMQEAQASGETTAVDLVRDHLARIEAVDWAGPTLNSVIEVNPDAEDIAAALDRERAEGRVRGPLHGIPITLKDAIATADRMQTTAGSLALVGSTVPRDAGIVRALREAGAVILGKNNMSEWNAYRGWPTRGGWSARAGMGVNPYALNHSTGDSSSGSAAAVAASLTAGAVGMETYGSIVMPASLCGVVGLKPTLGLTSRSGVIPISFSRDVTGPIARTVADAAALLGGMAGPDPLDPVTAASERHTHDYQRYLDAEGLRGARIGVWRRPDLWKDPDVAAIIEDRIGLLRYLGARVFDPIAIPNWMDSVGEHVGVMSFEFRHGIARYLAGLSNTTIRTLDDVIAFNEEHAAEELRWHDQGIMEGAAGEPPLSDPRYARALRVSATLARDGFGAAMDEHRLDAIVAPTFVPTWLLNLVDGDPYVGNGASGPSNAAGYPHITVPAGFVDIFPVGISFLARAWEEPKLLRYAYAFEQAALARKPPRYVPGFEQWYFVPRPV